MKKQRISDTISLLGDEILAEAAVYQKKKPAAGRPPVLRWGAAAACLALLVSGALFLPRLFRKPGESVPVANLIRPYRGATVRRNEIYVEWPWEYKMIFEQYREVVYNGQKYFPRAHAADSPLVGELLGTGEGFGYDYGNKETHRRSFAVHSLKGLSTDALIAVEMDGAYYVYLCENATLPATLGEFLNRYQLPQTAPLTDFSVREGFEDLGYYTLTEDDAIWELLSGCADSKLISDSHWKPGNQKGICFSVSSESLGVSHRVFYLTQDGYLWTNLFDWGALYEIGEESAGQILSRIRENAVEVSYTPSSYFLAGTLTEIGDGYILIDDSVLCRNPEDGMVFRVSTEPLWVKRCLDCLGLRAGDFVSVKFDGEIDIQNGNEVHGALSVSPALLSDGKVFRAE